MSLNTKESTGMSTLKITLLTTNLNKLMKNLQSLKDGAKIRPMFRSEEYLLLIKASFWVNVG